jgi:hypothetical protein
MRPASVRESSIVSGAKGAEHLSGSLHPVEGPATSDPAKVSRLTASLKIWLFLLLAVAATAQTSSSFTSLIIPSAGVGSRIGISGDRHLQPTPLGSLCANSAFAHGYRHGYDQGFHVGDLDLQLGREARVIVTSKEYRQLAREYRSIFGSRELFEKGYQAGFRSGYADAITGAEYRVRERTNTASAGLNPDLLPPNRRAHFDEGFASGYESAQTQGAPSQGMTADYVEQYCRKTASGVYALEYCSGFSRGYVLGIFNAPTTNTEHATSRAPEEALGNRQ